MDRVGMSINVFSHVLVLISLLVPATSPCSSVAVTEAKPGITRSPIMVITLKDGRKVSGRVSASRLKFQSTISIMGIRLGQITGFSGNELALDGIGTIEGNFVGGRFVVETSRGALSNLLST